MAILGLDIGEKRIGVAISKSEKIAQQYKTIQVENLNNVIDEILKICQKEKVGKIVVGLAKTLSGEIGFEAQRQKKFIEKLKNKNKDIKIIWQDERLTTKEAERILKEQNISKEKAKAVKDQLSAQIILQSYLE